MTVFLHELHRGRTALLIWTGAIAFLLAVSILLFPEMKKEMDTISNMFASMGSFTDAFGMDRLNFGTLTGYYAIECGNVLGLGGAFFASLIAVAMLSKEERGRTAEFLLTHPVSRSRVITEKLAALAAQILVMDIVIWLVAVGSMLAVGETVPWKEVCLLHLAYLLLQIELCGICYGISAFISRGGLGIGLGVAILMYFLNLIGNIAEAARPLKYVTPFAFCDGADIVTSGTLDWPKVAIGAAFTAAGIATAYFRYGRKDIAA